MLKLSFSKSNSFSYSIGEKTFKIDFIDSNIFRVAIFENADELLPTFNINPQNKDLKTFGRNRLSIDDFEMFQPEFSSSDVEDIFKLPGDICISLNKKDALISVTKSAKDLFHDRRPISYNLKGEFGKGSVHYISRKTDEKIFGLGDKSGKLNKSGRRFRMDANDSMGYDAQSTDPLYKNIPFFMCSNDVGNYGIFYDTSFTSIIDLGNEINNYYEPYKYFCCEENALIYYVFLGSKMQILQSFCKLVGKQIFPPRWSLDYNASTMAYTDADNAEEQMMDFLKKVKILSLNCGGFYLSSGYTQEGIHRYVFNWSKDKFPDIKGFVESFENENIHLIPNIKPAFLTTHPLFEEISRLDLFIKNEDGSIFLTQFWDGKAAYLDFTKTEAVDFWANKVEKTLLKYGIKATWNDNNEFDIQSDNAKSFGFGQGSVRAKSIRPILTYLMTYASLKAQMRMYPELRPFSSCRSGGVGIRRLAQTWSGDNRTNFDDLKFMHNIGLTLSLSGLYQYGHDLGGFSGDMPSRELLLRWIQHGVFEPRFTIHSWNADLSATMPWSYPDILDSVLQLFAERKRLIPYLYNCLYNSVMQDIPINSPVFMLFDDQKIPTESNAMMVGTDMLVSFVFEENKDKSKVYLPSECDWYLNDIKLSGGHEIEYLLPAEDIVPFFIKSGSVIPYDIGPSGFNQPTELEFVIYPLDEGDYTSKFFWDDGESFGYQNNDCCILNFSVHCDETCVQVEIEQSGNMKIDYSIKLVKSDKRQFEYKIIRG